MMLFLILFPLFASAVLFIFKADILNKIVTVFYAFAYFFASIAFLWIKTDGVPPYFKIDNLNIVFIIITATLYLGISLYNISYFKYSKIPTERQTMYYISLMLFIFSMNGFIFSQHLGLMWVFIEATTLATAYLIYFNRTDAALEAAWKYIFICTIGISFAFVGIIFISKGAGGNINDLFFDRLYFLAKDLDKFWINIGFLFVVLGFGTKMGLAPFHSWLPEAHSEAPSPMSAMLSGTLLNLACLGILRVYKIMVMAGQLGFAANILMIMGFLSLIFSAAFIMKIKNYKKMLAYSSIENMGIIAIGVSLGSGALFGVFLHLIGHSLTKAAYFLTAGNILHKYETKDAAKVRGILEDDKATGILWLLCFISITALPPFPLFISEFIMIKEFIMQGKWALLILFMLLLTLIMLGLIKTIFPMIFGKGEKQTHKLKGVMFYIPQIFFIGILLILGLYIPQPILDIINNAAKEIGM